LGSKLKNKWEVQCQTNTGEGGYLAMKDLWESGARPDGLVTAHEAIALGAMRYLHELGIRVPEDVSVTSYETSVLGGYSIPPLTSVNIKKEEMGAIAARMLLNRMDHPDAPLQKCIMDPELVVRGSVARK
jgi:DNA-binding LacI/PurR family transcriptional regulator